MEDDFISDHIDRALTNPFPGRFLADRNLFEDGHNLLEMIVGSIKYQSKSFDFAGIFWRTRRILSRLSKVIRSIASRNIDFQY
jgi:hypothetical protein